MQFTKPDDKYWDHKLAAYLHDPFDKAFDIKGHEERAAQILEIFGLDQPNEKYWKKADGIASGFERGQVPSYSSDENKNGAVNFVNNSEAILTHPIGKKAQLHIDLSHLDTNAIHETVKSYLKDAIGVKAGQGGYSKHFPDKPEQFSMARFLFAHLALRFKLADDNVAGLGALWHRLPADTRFPDHSIWQHNALTSALTSCMELAGDEDSLGLMVFSITPVQGFIANARKLRDFWTGSVLLSWLAFEGLKWVMENLGPDHVLYPSLVDQPLVNEYLRNEWFINEKSLTSTTDIASLPNKFVFLIPFNKADEIGQAIQQAINDSWRSLVREVEASIVNYARLQSPTEIEHVSKMIGEQTSNYWDLHWASSKLVAGDDIDELMRLLPEKAFKKQTELLQILNEIIKNKNYQKTGKGTLYSVSHQLAQSALAAQKMKRLNRRPAQNGEKCSLCTEFEVLHSQPHHEGQSAVQYTEHLKTFWKEVRTGVGGEKEIKDNEKLCAICYTKRLGYRIIRQHLKNHVLHNTFDESDSFPSTTEIAISDFCRRQDLNKVQSRELAEKIHDMNDEEQLYKILPRKARLNNSDKYYAILMMDGDKMGKLINGETIEATWGSIMHPIIRERLQSDNFDPLYKSNWETIFKEHPKRFITPSIHSAISEALADFSIYGVKPIIKKYNGRLIYAGGDDVCAVLPWQNAVRAAREISDYYKSAFKIISEDSQKDILSDQQLKIEKGKLAVLLGAGEQISISAGIVIAHHKENLSYLIQRAHHILDEEAKKNVGRDALAIELKKRYGGSRIISAKWDDELWESFNALQAALARSSKDLSRSLLYRISSFEDGLLTLIKQNDEERIEKFIVNLLEKSDTSKENEKQPKLAEFIRKVMKVERNDGHPEKLDIQGLIIAAFLARKEAE